MDDVGLIGVARKCLRGDGRPNGRRARRTSHTAERSPAATEHVEFEGQPHLLMAAEGWEEVAASISSWLDGVLDAMPVRAGGVTA